MIELTPATSLVHDLPVGINVRMSVIIGLVAADGGIGQMLFQFHNPARWRQVSVAVILIAAVMMTLDNVSAMIRERLIWRGVM